MRRPPPPLIKKFVKKVSVLVFDRFSKSLNSIAIYGVTLFQLYRLFVPLHDDSILSSTKVFEFILFMTDHRNKDKNSVSTDFVLWLRLQLEPNSRLLKLLCCSIGFL